MRDIDRVTAMEAVATAWNEAGIVYAVAHGVEGYPATIGRDLDVLVRTDQVGTGLMIAERVLKAQGFTVVRPSPLWGARLLAVHNASWDSALEIHTLTQLSWRNVMLADTPRPCEHQGPFQVDPAVSFGKRILLPLLADGIRRYAERPRDWTLHSEEHDAVPPLLHSLFGNELAQQLHRALATGDPSLAAPLVSTLRRTCMQRAWAKAPAASLWLLANAVHKKLLGTFTPCAPAVALVGPDGAGKSAVLQTLITGNLSVFTKAVVRNTRPNLLPRLPGLDQASTSVPGADGLLVTRCVTGYSHWLRMCYYLLDYGVGYIRDLGELSRQRLVLYDGHSLDMLVDPPRFGLQEGRSTWPLKRFAPKPDLVVLLYGKIEYVRTDNSAMKCSDVQQLQHWLQLADEDEVDIAISADGPLDQVSEEVKILIIKALIAKIGESTPFSHENLDGNDRHKLPARPESSPR